MPRTLDGALGPLLDATEQLNGWLTSDPSRSDEDIDKKWRELVGRAVRAHGARSARAVSRDLSGRDCRLDLLEYGLNANEPARLDLLPYLPSPHRSSLSIMLEVLEGAGLRVLDDPVRAVPVSRGDIVTGFWDRVSAEWRLVFPLSLTEPANAASSTRTRHRWGFPAGPIWIESQSQPDSDLDSTEEERWEKEKERARREWYRKYLARISTAFRISQPAASRFMQRWYRHERHLHRILGEQCWMSWRARGPLDHAGDWVSSHCRAAIVSASLAILKRQASSSQGLRRSIALQGGENGVPVQRRQRRIEADSLADGSDGDHR